MARKPKKAAYVVFRGRETGIVHNWHDCEKRVSGFSNASFQGFESLYRAEQAWNEHLAMTPPQHSSSSLLEPQPVGSWGKNVTGMISHGRALQHAEKLGEAERNAVKRPHSYVDLISSDNEDEKPTFKKPHINSDLDDEEGMENMISLNTAPKGEVGYPKLPPLQSPYFTIDLAGYNDGDMSAALQRSEEENMRSQEEDDFERDKSIILTPEQQSVVNMAMEGHNIFLTGAAGCGKTATLRKMMGRFRDEGIRYQVVAPTGIAALALNGKTAHSFMGWKPDSLQEPIKNLLKAKNYINKVKAIEKVDVLIIEEISMVENQFLERMNLVLKSMMSSQDPMGGKQIVFLGDFYQLPPVKPFEHCLECGCNMTHASTDTGLGSIRCGNPTCKLSRKPFSKGDQWAFKAPVWKELDLKHVKLDQIHRQKDGKFQAILNKVRNGVLLTDEEWNQMEANKDIPRGVCPVKLMSRKGDVEFCNRKALNELKFSPRSWRSIDSCWRARSEYENVDMLAFDSNEPWKNEDPFQNHRFFESLTLKIGAKVVLLTNLDPKAGLVNGSQGDIIGYRQIDPDANMTEDDHGRKRPIWEIEQLGAWRKLNVSEPIVRFTNGVEKLIAAFPSVSKKGTFQNPYMTCRVQIPLALAWALTIHKSQGMTLEYVEVSRKNIFEAGQLYVALSRATRLEGLILTGYDREQLAGDADVIKFYNSTDWNAHLREPRTAKGRNPRRQ